MTIIRLDWDDISLSECKRRISILESSPLVRQIELRLSARSGFHIIVSCENLNREGIYRLRRIWKDDGRRLVADILDRGYHRDVMFRYKVVAGTTWYEEPITSYTRVGHSILWKTKNLIQ